jgi:hypothetical protein
MAGYFFSAEFIIEVLCMNRSLRTVLLVLPIAATLAVPTVRANDCNVVIAPTTADLTFSRGKIWTTCNNYKLAFQTDGNLVIYNPLMQPLWATGTLGRSAGDRLTVGRNGNVVLSRSETILWSTNTASNTGARLILQTDGNLVVYTAQNRPVYNTGTYSGRVATLKAASEWSKRKIAPTVFPIDTRTASTIRSTPIASPTPLPTLAPTTPAKR